MEDTEVTGETKAIPNIDVEALEDEEVTGETKAIPNIEDELEKAAESEQTNVPTLDLEFDMPEIISGTDDSVLGNQLPEEDLVNYDIEETIQYEKEELEELNNIIDSERMMNIEGEPEEVSEYEEPEVVTEKLPKKRLSELSADLEEIFNNDIIDFRDMPAEELERERRESILISDIDKTMELERPKSISDLVKEAEENIISEEPEVLDEPLEETVGEPESDTIDEDAAESTEPESDTIDEDVAESTEPERESIEKKENESAETIEDYETIDDVEEVEDSEDEPIEDYEEPEEDLVEEELGEEDLVEEELEEDLSENLTKDEPEETKKSEMENVEIPEVSAEMDKIAQEIESMPEISIPELDIPKIEIPNLDLPDLSDEDALELSDLTDVADSKEDSEATEEVELSEQESEATEEVEPVEQETESTQEVETVEEKTESTQEVELLEQESDAVEEGIVSEQKTEPKSSEEKESETKEEKYNSGTKIVTDEDMKVFANYTNIEGLDDTIKYTIEKLVKEFVPDGNSSNGNIAISGDEKSGKTTLAIDIIKMVNAKRGRTGRRIAKVNAEVLNRRGFTAALNKLVGSDLIVEKATDLNSEQIDEIIKSAKLYTNDMLIVLEGETDAMADMFDENEELKQIFDYPILIKTYNVKEWVAYGVQYAKDNGFNINEMGMLALFKAIDDWYGTKKEISQKDVEQILDAAIKRAKHKLGRKIVGIFKTKDKDDLQILKESDFNIK